MASLQITLIGGPTALIEIGGFRLLTDPTFDPPGDYQLPHVTLTKPGAGAFGRPGRSGRCGPAQPRPACRQSRQCRQGSSSARPPGADDGDGAKRLGAPSKGWRHGRTTELVKPGQPAAASRPPPPDTARPASSRWRRRDRLRRHASGRPADLRHRRHGLVRRRRRGRAPLPAGPGVPFAGAAHTRGPFHLTMDTNDAVETAHHSPTPSSCPSTTKAGRISRRAARISTKPSTPSASVPPEAPEAGRRNDNQCSEPASRDCPKAPVNLAAVSNRSVWSDRPPSASTPSSRQASAGSRHWRPSPHRRWPSALATSSRREAQSFPGRPGLAWSRS